MQLQRPEIMRAYRQKWIEKNPEKQKAAVTKHRDGNMHRIRERSNRWKKANRDKVSRQQRRRYAQDPEGQAAVRKQWRKDNPDKAKVIALRSRQKRKREPQNRLDNAIREGVRRGLKREPGTTLKTFEVLGYSKCLLVKHLESLFTQGMTWDNYGEWHVDHVYPLSRFSYSTTDDPQFKEAWRLENLQPLWAKDNLRKGNRV
jgi:hypothetical protein